MFKLGSLLILAAFSSEPQTITWVFTSASPSISPLKANIVDDKHDLFKLYRAQLSDYQHTSFTGTIPRIEIELKRKTLACYPGSSDASRRKEFTYLTSQYIQPAPQLIVKKELADRLRLQYKNGIYLKEILKEKKLAGLIGEARSYGVAIDKILSNNLPNNIKKGVFETFGPSSLNMIEKGRADYTIEYPFILHNLRESALIGTELVNLPLLDVGQSMTQYLACSKTPEGLAVIKRADKIIREHVRDNQYWTGVLQSMPEADRPSFQKEINKFVETRSKTPVIIE